MEIFVHKSKLLFPDIKALSWFL